jgi:hypothetical protein
MSHGNRKEEASPEKGFAFAWLQSETRDMPTRGMHLFNHYAEKTFKLRESNPALFLRALKVFYVYLKNVIPIHRTCHVVDESVLDRQCFECSILESDKRHYGWRKQVDLFALVSFYNSKLRQAKKGLSATEAEKKMKEDVDEMIGEFTKKVATQAKLREKAQERKRKRLERVSLIESCMKICAVTLLYNETKFPGRGYCHFDDRYLGVKVAVTRLLRRYWNEKTGYETINMFPYRRPKKFRPGTATHNLLLEEFKRMERHHRDYCDLMFDFPLKKDNCFRSDKYWWPIIQSKVRPYINWC